jgi:molybdopterin guanine dinucleotide-containing S/N-oxide reductase-like protein
VAEQVFQNATVVGPVSVYVNDGVITRVRPLQVDGDDLRPWTVEDTKGGKHSPGKKMFPGPEAMAVRSQVYSKDRILYPMKRVDFDPNGERNPQNRGKSGYERISWDEALDMVANEMKRIREKYGPEAITALDQDHHNWGIVGYRFGPFFRFFNTIGFTECLHNPDSWEGWHWGVPHTIGYWWQLGVPEQYDILEDLMKYSEQIVFWSIDPDWTRCAYNGMESAQWLQWMIDSGKQLVFIDPYCNYSAARMADKWIPVRPNTDAALALAIAYVWIKEGTYNKEYVADKTVGFEEFTKYVLGESDGTPKSPEWAAEITAVPARTLEDLAHEWAAKKTTVSGCGMGAGCRVAYGHEYPRLVVLLQAMQGLGTPGVNLWGNIQSAPADYSVQFPGYADLDAMMSFSRAATIKAINPVQQKTYRLMLPDMILNPPVRWMGEGFCGQSMDQHFAEFEYPMPGHSEIHMYYRYGGASMGTMCEGNKQVLMYQSPKLEMVVNQDWCWCTETKFADVILPACTNFERNDIGEWGEAGGYLKWGTLGSNYRVITYQQKCIEPLGESKSDYWIFSELAKRLGVWNEFSDGGKLEDDWIKAYFDVSDLPKRVSWEDFLEKGYHIINAPPAEEYKSTVAFRWYAEGRPCDTPDWMNPMLQTDTPERLATPSGKIEFVSGTLAKHTPDDPERQPIPRYIPSWEGHESELFKKYPLQLITPHPRYSFHTHFDKKGCFIADIPGHRILIDGYHYWTVRIHPEDAAFRGIKDRDIVKLYNDRASVLGAAMVTERIKPGVIHSYCSCSQYDPVQPGEFKSLDRGGCMNLLTSDRLMSKNAPGMAPCSCLIEIEKWEA